jgi:hypothetical protein
MAQISRTSELRTVSESVPIVIHCSDPQYLPHFQEFLRNTLELDRYALVAVPGGAQFLTAAEALPKYSWVGWRWLEFLYDVAQAERVVLIGHDGCRWYLKQRFAPSPALLPERIAEDLRRVRESLLDRYPHLHVELYFARVSGSHATVEPV